MVTNQPHIIVVDCGSTKVPEILKQVELFATSEVIKLNDITSKIVSTGDGIIISGAPILITEVDVEPYLEKFDFLRSYKKPVLGICFGHQILGLLFNAEASKCVPSRTTEEITQINPSELLNQIPKKFPMSQDHCECISLPEGFIHVASSQTCLNEMMIHTQKPFIGVQFHPEVSAKYGAQFFENFFENLF